MPPRPSSLGSPRNLEQEQIARQRLDEVSSALAVFMGRQRAGCVPSDDVTSSVLAVGLPVTPVPVGLL